MPLSRLQRTIEGLRQLAARSRAGNFLEVLPETVIIRPLGDERLFVKAVWMALYVVPLAYGGYVLLYGLDSWLAPPLLLLFCIITGRDIYLVTFGQQYVDIDLKARVFRLQRLHQFYNTPPVSEVPFDRVKQVTLTHVSVHRLVKLYRISFVDHEDQVITYFDLRPDVFSFYLAGKLRLLLTVVLKSC
ncbi:hypothetical protein SAMN05444266_111168 [Chitinophaga jiangningensis]|uniref:Uncharacterized protein n=1 Tax=Chitinophaga jiangningensis TaxID=1419482 RepID=A0A1M7LVS5_9BACT|nr:hypothetical protein [Chitinophaga jiangningensis]SHM82235.1 hypothetical protein SAMN05444266_111168 [Chitinophaga jiangningensis]